MKAAIKALGPAKPVLKATVATGIPSCKSVMAVSSLRRWRQAPKVSPVWATNSRARLRGLAPARLEKASRRRLS